MKEITQRELRNDSGEIMRGLDAGESYLVTRNGVGVGELVPPRRSRWPRVGGRDQRGVLDTSVVIDLPLIRGADLPLGCSVAAITLAELAAGPHAAADPVERARRQDRLQLVERTFDPLAFDSDAARAYGRICALVQVRGRKPRGARAADLLIAATGAAHALPLYTRNPGVSTGLDEVLRVATVSLAPG